MARLDIETLRADMSQFAGRSIARLASLGVEVTNYPIGHVAFRTGSMAEYVEIRDMVENACVGNVENEWSGRPISKLLLRTPVPVSTGHTVPLLELIPPVHRAGYGLGLEHVGFVIGQSYDQFEASFRSIITCTQDQGPFNHPHVIAFDDSTLAKFHRHSLHDVVLMEGRRFDGFDHIESTLAE